MTSDESDSRRIADELRRRERQGSRTEAPVDPDTLKAILEQHANAVVTLVGQIEKNLAAKIDTLAKAQGAAAETLSGEIKRGMKGGEADKIAALERQLREEQRAALESLSTELKQKLETLTQSLNSREGGVFAGIDGVAEGVKPAAEALGKLQQAVAGTAVAARDVAAIREAVVDNRSAVDEVATIRKTVADSAQAIAAVVAMGPVLDKVEAGLETWSTNTRRLRRFGWTLLVVLPLLFCAGGAWRQKETGIWPPTAGSDDYWRDFIWERYRAQIVPCIKTAQTQERDMSCTFGDMDP